MKILVTGSNGLLGQKLVKLLIEEKVEVIATSRGKNRIDYINQPFEYCEMDITNSVQVAETISRYKPDVVIHTAAMTNVDQCEQEKEACWVQNVSAVQYLVDACEINHSFLIHLSTDFIFDGENGPYKEDDKPNPISYYGSSKLEAEQIVKSAKCDWAILRTVLVYGITPGMSRSNIILWVKESLENKKTLNIVDDQWRTPTLAEDLAMGCYLVAKQHATGIFNISGDQLLTPFEMAKQTAEYFDLDFKLVNKVDASTFSQPAKRPPKTGFVLDKAKNQLNYQPHTFEEGIKILEEQMTSWAD